METGAKLSAHLMSYRSQEVTDFDAMAFKEVRADVVMKCISIFKEENTFLCTFGKTKANNCYEVYNNFITKNSYWRLFLPNVGCVKYDSGSVVFNSALKMHITPGTNKRQAIYVLLKAGP